MGGAWQLQHPDLASIFLTGLARRDAREARKEEAALAREQFQAQTMIEDQRTRAGIEQQRALAGAVSQAQQGDYSQLVQLDPERAKAMQGFAAEQTRGADDIAKRTAERQQWASRVLAASPGKAQFVQQHIDDEAKTGRINRFSIGGDPSTFVAEGLAGPQVLPTRDEAENLGLEAGAVLGEEKPQSLTTLSQNLIEAGFARGTPEYQRAMRKAMDDEAKAKTININNGSAAASNKTTSGQEEALLDAQDQLAMLGEVRTLATGPDGAVNFGQFLGVGAKGKKLLLDVMDSINPEAVPEEMRGWYEKMATFRSVVDDYKAGRYNKLLGSAQSAAEVRNLMNAVLSADMNSTQFTAAFERMENVLARKIRVAEQVLAEGIPLGGRDYRTRFVEIENGERVSPKLPGGKGTSKADAPQKSPEQIVDEAIARGEVPQEQRGAAIRALRKRVGGGQ